MDRTLVLDMIERLTRQQLSGISVERLVLISMALVVVLNVLLFLYEFVLGRKLGFWKRAWLSLLVVYCCFMYMITVEKREPGSRNAVRIDLYFGSLRGTYLDVMQAVFCILNVVFFVPLGALFSWIGKKGNPVWMLTKITVLSFASSLLIETWQLVTQRGYFELTDLITNTLGGFLGGLAGVIALALWNGAFGRTEQDQRERSVKEA